MKREYPEQPLVALGIIVHHENQILLIKRAKEPNKGQWSLPGGAQDVGETVYEGAARETEEETGVRTKNHELVDIVDSIHQAEDGRVRYHYTIIEVSCDYAGGEMQASDDALDAKWFSFDEMKSLDLPPKTLMIVEKSIKLYDQRSRKASFTEE